MEIKNFVALVTAPKEWIEGRYSAFAGKAQLFVNGNVVDDGPWTPSVGDHVEVATPCNTLQGTISSAVTADDRNWRFQMAECTYVGAFRGVGGDYDGFCWNPTIPDNAPVVTSLGKGVKTWSGYCRFREELAEAAVAAGATNGSQIGVWGSVPLAAAERALRDFQAARPLTVSERDFA